MKFYTFPLWPERKAIFYSDRNDSGEFQWSSWFYAYNRITRQITNSHMIQEMKNEWLKYMLVVIRSEYFSKDDCHRKGKIG